MTMQSIASLLTAQHRPSLSAHPLLPCSVFHNHLTITEFTILMSHLSHYALSKLSSRMNLSQLPCFLLNVVCAKFVCVQK